MLPEIVKYQNYPNSTKAMQLIKKSRETPTVAVYNIQVTKSFIIMPMEEETEIKDVCKKSLLVSAQIK